MTRDEKIRNKLEELGCEPIVFAEGNRMVYIPMTFIDKHPEIIQELKLRECPEDSFLSPMRSINTKKALKAFAL